MASGTGIVQWKKRILIPAWVVRIVLMVFTLTIYGMAIKLLYEDEYKTSPAMGVVIFFMLLVIGVLLLDLLAIVLFLRNALRPTAFLVMNVVQSFFWVVVIVIDFVAIAKGTGARGIWFPILALVSFLGLLIYSAQQYHKQRKEAQRGLYGEVRNPVVPVNTALKSTAYPQLAAPVELQASPPPKGAAVNYHQVRQV
ncbi:hypothetical protein GQ43DRAFT_375314 [Delitschia confertaspora ATCC 74209]|uniref:MARVEL domain-containing protein n=1 Tax=Delitschia confertaspora ATCC 74209 TaxID=1513339 RepID=A0A9P4JII7_9PLEO|nr:hypothetical protein GQ43DRAFT_375314 [Delitschia confertaspora ATCC 74209]